MALAKSFQSNFRKSTESANEPTQTLGTLGTLDLAEKRQDLHGRSDMVRRPTTMYSTVVYVSRSSSHWPRQIDPVPG